MLRFIVLVAFVANLHCVLTEDEVAAERVGAADDISIAKPICKVNEELSDCPNKVCREKTCSDLGYGLPCLSAGTDGGACARPRCLCAEGYVRDRRGVCILKQDCPSCGGDVNATAGCGNFCTTCANYKQENVPCPAICRINGCECKPKHVYDTNKKKCVLPEQCPCARNEVRSDCANQCILEKCSQKDLAIKCKPNPATCKPGCVCAEGYLRNEKGVCIPRDQCPKICSKKNEYWDKCPVNCPDPECGIGVIPSFAPCTKPSNPANCRPACRCKNGHFRNDDDDCVAWEECPPECGANEALSDCGNDACLPDCSQPDKPKYCKFDRRNCKPGCVCAGGYLRDKDGVCVPRETCLNSCNGDPNAVPGCGQFCTRCSNYKNKNRACTLSCILDGCECRDKYIYDDLARKCVLPDDCTPTCPANEVPSTCGNNGCLNTCAEPERLTYCDYDPSSCKPGCVCAEGRLRDDKGVCVLKDKCLNNTCLLPPDSGSCRGRIPKFYYDSSKKECIQFNYGGCQGNDNKFDTKSECLQKCSDCFRPPETGLCRAVIPKFYYDPSSKDCLEFIYGGCGGNDNKYDSKRECLQKCNN